MHISLSPNLELDDFFAALSSLILIGSWFGKKSIDAFQKDLAKYFDNPHIYLTASGRGALYIILKSLNIQKGDEIILQAFTCNAVANPIIWAGAKPIYADIDETFNINANKLRSLVTNRTRAIIVQHTFGIPADLEKIIEIARQANIILIEDCAHALGATYKGRKIGTFGDAAFFSFGRDKVISSVYGGAIAVNEKKINEKIQHTYAYTALPKLWWVLQQLLHPVLTYPISYVYGLGGKYMLVLLQKLKVLSYAVSRGERISQMPPFINWRMDNALAYLARYQFKKLERFNNHRRTLAAFYEKELAGNARFTIVKKYDKGSVFLRYPILADNAAQILLSAKEKKIIWGDWYREVIAPHGTDMAKMGYTQGMCPAAEAGALRIINLPTNIRTTRKDARKILNFLQEI